MIRGRSKGSPVVKAGYESLANAIITQAVADYRNAKNPAQRRKIELFFQSGWFVLLSNCNGKALLQKLEEEIEAEKESEKNEQKRC